MLEANPTRDAITHLYAVCALFQDYVRAHRFDVITNRPYVKVRALSNSRRFQDCAGDLGGIQMPRDCLEQDGGSLFEHTPATERDEHCNHDAEKRVGARPVEEHDADARTNGTHRTERIRQD